MLRHGFDGLWNWLFRFFLFRFFIFFTGLDLCLNHFSKEIIFHFLINSFLSIKIKSIFNFFNIAGDLTGLEISIINGCRLIRNIFEDIGYTFISSCQKFFILWFFWEWKTIFIIFLEFKPFDFEILIIFRNQHI